MKYTLYFIYIFIQGTNIEKPRDLPNWHFTKTINMYLQKLEESAPLVSYLQSLFRRLPIIFVLGGVNHIYHHIACHSHLGTILCLNVWCIVRVLPGQESQWWPEVNNRLILLVFKAAVMLQYTKIISALCFYMKSSINVKIT